MSKITYNPWPLGKLPKEWQRKEPDLLKEKGYHWSDPRDIVTMFEDKLATFTGAPYVVTTDCCTHGIHLVLEYFATLFSHNPQPILTIPKRTYISIPMTIKHTNFFDFTFEDLEWQGQYQIKPLPVWDSAVRFTKDMYIKDQVQVLSFQIKKRIPIGRGGAILTNDYNMYKWLKLASYDGRDLETEYMSPQHVTQIGWHYYMTPEDAARGILLMDQIPEINEDTGGSSNYFDLSTHPFFGNT